MKNLKEYIDIKKNKRLHLGCGGIYKKEWVNVDFYPAKDGEQDSSRSGCKADVYADMRELRLDNNTIDEIFTSHTIDHFTKWVALDMLTDWHRMLKSGGKLTIEAADFWRCLIWLFHPSKKYRWLGRSQFYGNQWDRIDYETHRYLWSGNELKEELLKIGFSNVVVRHDISSHHKWRDFHINAVK